MFALPRAVGSRLTRSHLSSRSRDRHVMRRPRIGGPSRHETRWAGFSDFQGTVPGRWIALHHPRGPSFPQLTWGWPTTAQSCQHRCIARRRVSWSPSTIVDRHGMGRLKLTLMTCKTVQLLFFFFLFLFFCLSLSLPGLRTLRREGLERLGRSIPQPAVSAVPPERETALCTRHDPGVGGKGWEAKPNIPGFSPKLPRHSGYSSRYGSQ